MDLHLVNYNRTEPPRGGDGKPSAGGGIKDEKPIAAQSVKVDLLLPEGFDVGRVEVLVPEWDGPVMPAFSRSGRRVKLEVPGFPVYCVVRVLPKSRP